MIADENYLRESILNPGSKVVSGFRPIMPTFSGILSEDQLLSLISYMKSLSQPQQSEPSGIHPSFPVRTGRTTVPSAGNTKVQ